MSTMMEGLTKPANFVPFELHPNTLRMIIQEQAGTWEKAIAELVMNSVDAGAERIDINYTTKADSTNVDSLTVLDDGHGFHNEDQLNFFKVFGAPHEQNDAFYGKYRIGRGQCLSFGRVTWRSHNYEMHVDLGDPNEKETPLDKIGYNLNYYDELHKGCSVKVEFFNPIRFWPDKKNSEEKQVRDIFNGLIELIKFVPIPVFINGYRISFDYSKINWTYEDDNAYYLIQTMTNNRFKDLKDYLNEVSIYNRGVFATDFPATWKGCCGVVITKKQIKLNMARNSIVDHDEYWFYIRNKIDELSSLAFTSTITEPKSDEERAVVINQIYLDDTFAVVNTTKQIEHFMKMPLFKMQSGKILSIVDLIKNTKMYTVCTDPIGRERTTISEQLEKKKIAVLDRSFFGANYVFGRDFAENFEYNAQLIFLEFLKNISGITAIEEPHHVLFEVESKYGEDYIEKHNITIESIVRSGRSLSSRLYNLIGYMNLSIKFSNYEKLADGLDVTYKGLTEKDLNDEELACFKAIRRMNAKFKEYGFDERKIKVGESDHAIAWTDSFSTIWITKQMLYMLRNNEFTKVVQILLHEYCHKEGNLDTHASHKHNLEFYNEFHRLCMKLPLDTFSDLLKTLYVRWLANSKTRPSSKITYSLDRAFEYYPDLVRKNTPVMRHRFGRMGRKFESLSKLED